MKKQCFLIFAALLLSSTAWGQVRLGLTGGASVTKLSFSKSRVFSSENRTGWFIGPKMWVALPATGLGVNVALEYSQRRLYSEAEAGGAEVSRSKYHRSLEIPINLRYSLGPAKIARIYAETGPQLSYTIGGRKLSDMMRADRANFLWNIGAGVRVLNKVEAGVTYSMAVGNTGKAILPATAGKARSAFKSNFAQIQAAYLF